MVEEAEHVPVDASKEAIASDIELSFVNQQWIFNVLLDNGSFIHTGALVADEVLDFIEVLGNYDSRASICVLTRLDNPHIIHEFGRT